MHAHTHTYTSLNLKCPLRWPVHISLYQFIPYYASTCARTCMHAHPLHPHPPLAVRQETKGLDWNCFTVCRSARHREDDTVPSSVSQTVYTPLPPLQLWAACGDQQSQSFLQVVLRGLNTCVFFNGFFGSWRFEQVYFPHYFFFGGGGVLRDLSFREWFFWRGCLHVWKCKKKKR